MPGRTGRPLPKKNFFKKGIDISVHVCYTVFVSEGAEPTQGKSQSDT